MGWVNKGVVLRLTGIGILVVQGVLTYGLARDEYLPSPAPLAQIPRQIGEWGMGIDQPIEQSIVEMLGPDDILSRDYRDLRMPRQVNFFVSYYKTQHRARNAHDPKLCLPGAGWEPQVSEMFLVRSCPR